MNNAPPIQLLPYQVPYYNNMTARHVSAEGGYRSGKTEVGTLALLHRLIYNWNPGEGQTEPNYVSALLVGADQKTIEDANIPKLKKCAEQFNLDLHFEGIRKNRFLVKSLSTKSRPVYIYIRNAQNGKAIIGFEVGVVLLDECGRYKDATFADECPFLNAEARCSDPRARLQQLFYASTPDNVDSKWYRMFHEEESTDRAWYNFSTSDNTFLPKEHIERKREMYSETEYAIYVEGKGIDYRGNAAYHAFTDENIDETLDLDTNLDLHIAADFGAKASIVIGQYDPEQDLFYSVHEIQIPEVKTIQALEHVGDILSAYPKFPFVWVYGDPNGNTRPDVGSSSNYTEILNWVHREGMLGDTKLLRQTPLQIDRVNCVNALMRSHDGVTRYKVHPRCSGLIRDFKLVKWRSDAQTTMKLRKSNELSHLSDALGYELYFDRPIMLKPRSSYEVDTRMSFIA